MSAAPTLLCEERTEHATPQMTCRPKLRAVGEWFATASCVMIPLAAMVCFIVGLFWLLSPDPHRGFEGGSCLVLNVTTQIEEVCPPDSLCYSQVNIRWRVAFQDPQIASSLFGAIVGNIAETFDTVQDSADTVNEYALGTVHRCSYKKSDFSLRWGIPSNNHALGYAALGLLIFIAVCGGICWMLW